ncbi:hypothetical protein GCM10023340_15550 [Nocardioides marinquilinus]|uniref:Sugar ABC transporter ATPase n=2 Tax=Nocardioides marinquilinus TaxID=1210400 RepID=A0ABP9PGB0_9ACTN
MSDTGSHATDLGPMPAPRIEPGEPDPGGVDAVAASDGVDGETAEPEPLARDLDPADNPAADDSLPDEMRQTEDTDTEATRSADTDEIDLTEESPA